MGIVKSVDSRGAATIHVSELGSSYDKVVPLNTTNLNRVAIGDVVKCTFSDEFFTELIVLGVANIKEVPAISSFSPVISSPIPGQVIQYNGTSWVNASASDGGFEYRVGDTGPGGGIVFFVDRYDEHEGFTYLEVAPSSADSTVPWAQTSPVNYSVTAVDGAKSQALGGGYQNSLDIVAQGNDNPSSCAAKYCLTYTGGGQTDWYLPSVGELMTIHNSLHRDKGIGNFIVDGQYWSSTETAFYAGGANYLAFYNGITTYGDKNGFFYGGQIARPVRRF